MLPILTLSFLFNYIDRTSVGFPARFLTGVAAAGGLAFINSVGAFGGFVGPFAMGWLKDFTGSFNAGLVGMAVLGLVSAVLALMLRMVVREE